MQYDDHMRHGENEGMGGYLDPPGYPTHTYSVSSGSKTNPHSFSSIAGIADCEYIDPKIRQQGGRPDSGVACGSPCA